MQKQVDDLERQLISLREYVMETGTSYGPKPPGAPPPAKGSARAAGSEEPPRDRWRRMQWGEHAKGGEKKGPTEPGAAGMSDYDSFGYHYDGYQLRRYGNRSKGYRAGKGKWSWSRSPRR